MIMRNIIVAILVIRWIIEIVIEDKNNLIWKVYIMGIYKKIDYMANTLIDMQVFPKNCCLDFLIFYNFYISKWHRIN
jgi:hypothetical protein